MSEIRHIVLMLEGIAEVMQSTSKKARKHAQQRLDDIAIPALRELGIAVNGPEAFDGESSDFHLNRYMNHMKKRSYTEARKYAADWLSELNRTYR
jgi:hypothetical protein